MAATKKKLPVINFEAKDVDPDDQSMQKGIVCQGCELEPKRRCPGAGAHGEVDIMFVSESPSSWSVSNNRIFGGKGGKIIREAWKELLAADNASGGHLRMKHLKKWDTYAVQCQVEEGRDQSAQAGAATIQRCANYLRAAISQKKPKIIVPLGATALKALGYKTEKFTEARGRVLQHVIDGREVLILPTFGTKQLLGKTGLFHLFYNDFTKAVKVASGVDEVAAQISLEELSKDYILPKTVAEVKELCDLIIEYKVEGAPSAAKCALAVDTETNTVNPHRADAKVLCISFAWDAGRATAIPLFHPKAPWSPSELDEVLFHVKRVLECPKPKIFHNAGFDLRFLELRHGLRVVNVAWDTMLGEHLLREDMSGSYSLKVLGRSYFPQFANYADKVAELAAKLTVEEEGVATLLKDLRKKKIKAPGFEDGFSMEMGKAQLEAYLYGAKKHRKKRTNDSGYERVPLDILLPYAAVDTDLTRRLLRNQIARVANENCPATHTLMKTHCIPASRVLGKMEFDGFPVDRPYLDFLEAELGRIVDEKMIVLRQLWAATAKYYPDKRDEEFNPNSTQHIAWLLFTGGVVDPDNPVLDVNGHPRPATRQGPWCEINKSSKQFKTDKKTLKAIAEKTKCPFARTLLEYRAAHKALTGFVAEIKVLSEYDGRVHTAFFLHGTSTGRLASRNPNMQNLPARKIAGINIKKLFIPDDPEEEVIFNVDWKGAEIRVFTAYARDAQLEKAINDGLDVHSWFTQEIFGIPYDEVEAKKEIDPVIKETRTTVKRVVFGILYGAMAKKIAETAGITEERAQEVIDKLFDRFPSLKGYMDEVVAHINKYGFVETFFGRRRRFPLVRVNGFFRGQAERRGKNMKIQSTSSDIVIGQLIEIAEHIHELGGRLCITVHDSIVGTIKKKYLHLVEAFFQKYCVDRVAEKYPWLPVAFACDISVGPSYGEVIDIKAYLAKHPLKAMTPEQEFYAELDDEALLELREDEDEARAREQAEAAALEKSA